MVSILTMLGDAGTFSGVIVVLVLVHEFGHYLAARANGVRVEVFSIGLGPELIGFKDRAGTRWRIAALPIGGYVKLFGRGDGAAAAGAVSAAAPPASFQHQHVARRAAIVAAGPLANFVFAFAVLALLLVWSGRAAAPLASGLDHVLAAIAQAASITGQLGLATALAVAQFLGGAHGAGEVIGPVRAAAVSGALSREGWPLLALWLAMFSVNLGVTNLLPIPALDGGQLLFCAIEAIRGRPLDGRLCRNSARIGLALVLGLMAFATLNDLVQLGSVG